MKITNELVKVGDIIEWVEPHGDDRTGEDLTLRTNVIEHRGELWANGCGSVKRIIETFEYEINPE